MASKKRSHDEDLPSVHKKRIVSGINGTPVVNGVADRDEPSEDDNLELFRKEAIFRKMKYYAKEFGRSQQQIEELQRRRTQCEAGLVAISACWRQILDTVQTLAKPEDMPSPSKRVEDAFNISACVQDNTPDAVKHILDDRVNATQAVVSRFFQLAPSHYAKLDDPSYINYQATQTECASLRSRVDSLAVQLQESEAIQERYRQELAAAENRIARLNSQSVRATERPHPADRNGVPPSDNEGTSRNPSPPAHSTAAFNGLDSLDWKAKAESRGLALDKAREDIARLNLNITGLNTRINNPPLSMIVEHPQYKFILEKISHLQHNLAESQAQALQAQESMYQAVKARLALEENMPFEQNQEIQELKTALARRDNDISRLREIRDQQQAELNERRSKDTIKMNSLQEFKSLAEARGEMISSLQNQLRQSRAHLAAIAGKEDVLKFLFEPHEISYVEDIQARLTAAQEQLDAYRRSMALYEGDRQLAVDEHSRTLERLTKAEAELAKYREIYGSTSMSAESSALSDELERKEEELRRLRLETAQQSQGESSLYAELDKLSAAWESLDNQLKTKVFDFASLEERVSKSGVERAKSENKYYQSMREKEAIETERKALQRVLEKQEKVVERIRASETNLQAQIHNLEQEAELYRNSLKELKIQIQTTDNDYLSAKGSSEEKAKDLKLMENDYKRAVKKVEDDKVAVAKAKDVAAETLKENERLAAKLQVAVASASKPTRESDVQKQLDETLAVLMCSTCKQSIRSIVLSKCLHTFCKDCIDARISTRQRKCPSCNLAFSAGDVMQMYFQ